MADQLKPGSQAQNRGRDSGCCLGCVGVAFVVAVVLALVVKNSPNRSDSSTSSTKSQPTQQPAANGLTSTRATLPPQHALAPVDDALKRASEAYKNGNVAEAIAILEAAHTHGDARVKTQLALYKRDDPSKLVAQARELYRHRRYEDAVNKLVSASDRGSQEAQRLLPDYEDRWNRSLQGKKVPASPPANVEPSGDGWRLVKRFSGRATKDTETFQITADEWRIDWATRAGDFEGNFVIHIYNSDGTEKGLAANVIGAGQDNTTIRGAGSYYLSIITSQPYAIEIRQAP